MAAVCSATSAASCYPFPVERVSVTRAEVKELSCIVGQLRLYRSSYGCCLAARLETPLDFRALSGRLSGLEGCYLVVDEHHGLAWVENRGSFEAVYREVLERDTRPPGRSPPPSTDDS